MKRTIERALVWIGPALLVLGLFTHRLWTQWPSGRFLELVVIALVALGLAQLLRMATRWSLPSALAAVWLLALALFAGPLPVLATLLFCLTMACLGCLAFPVQPLLLQVLLGALMLAGVVGWLLLLPLHHGWSYGVLCVALLAWRRRELGQQLRTTSTQWNEAVQAAPGMALAAVMIVGLAMTPAWLPTLQYDDLTYHLRLPWQLQQQGFYDPAPECQVWAFAPWTSDILHAIPQLMAHQEARGPVNALWCVLLCGGVWQLCRNLGATPQARWCAIALVASLPLTAALAASMQTEPLTATAVVWLAALVAEPRRESPRFWLALAVLCGGLAALKLVALVLATVLLGWALLRHRRPSWQVGVAALGACIGLAGSSYAYGWLLAGNPLLPLFNRAFKSPYFAAQDFNDPRWHTGFSLDLPWQLTFETSRYMECYNGAAGFVLVGLCGLWLLALLQRQTRGFALVATALLTLPLLPLQYLRYTYPGLVLLCVALVMAALPAGRRVAPLGLLLALCVLNLAFQANANWMLRNGAIKQTIKAMGRDQPLMARFAPARALAMEIRASGEDAGTVLSLSTQAPFFAEFGTRGRSISWYAPHLQHAAQVADLDASGHAWQSLLRAQRVQHVILDDSATPAQLRGLERLGATRRDAIGTTAWWSIPTYGAAQ